MNNYTDITVLVDRSGSMASIKEAMESAYREFLRKHKKIPSTRITLITFDDWNPQEVQYMSVPVRAAEALHIEPRGNTPLLDAMAATIDNTGKRLARIPAEERPAGVLFVVITDGQENASKHTTRKDVFERVTHQRETYNWQFVYLGANQDSFKEASQLGFYQGHTINYAANAIGTRNVGEALATNTLGYTSSMFAGEDANLSGFTSAQRKKALDSE